MLASEYGCSNDVVFETEIFLGFFQIFSENLDLKKSKTEDLNSLFGNCEGTLSGCQSCL